MHKCNLHKKNTAMFKAINDHARESEFKGTWDKDVFKNFFVPHYGGCKDPKPSIDDLITTFELLDPMKEGKITAQTFAENLLAIEKLRRKNFDLEQYFKGELDEDPSKDEQLL